MSLIVVAEIITYIMLHIVSTYKWTAWQQNKVADLQNSKVIGNLFFAYLYYLNSCLIVLSLSFN